MNPHLSAAANCEDHCQQPASLIFNAEPEDVRRIIACERVVEHAPHWTGKFGYLYDERFR